MLTLGLKRRQFLIKHEIPFSLLHQNKTSIGNSKPEVGPEDSKLIDKVVEETKEYVYTLSHPIWSPAQVTSVEITHRDTRNFRDKWAYFSVWTLRKCWDLLSGWNILPINDVRAAKRIIFLETLAGVPGMAGAMVRHLQSLRLMRRDNGWIHTLLEEAENERIHLLVALQLHESSRFMRFMVLVAQGVFTNFFFFCYLISPAFCHRFVGYLEEEAVKTYTKIVHEIDEGNLKVWKTTPAPLIARNYWKLPVNATVRDVMFNIRADEANHRDVNHVFADLKPTDTNPFKAGE